MRMIGGEKAQDLIGRLDQFYERHDGVAQPHAHGEAFVHTAGLDITPRG